MGKFIAIIIFAVLFYILGTTSQAPVFAKNSAPQQVLDKKTTIHTTQAPEAHTEPLTTSNVKVTDSQPLKTEDKDIHVPTSNEDIVWNRLIAEGFSKEQTAGIMGNLQQEHRFRTDGDGLAQWIGARKEKLLARANASTIEGQLDYLMEELNGPYLLAKQEILASGLDGALLAFQNKYEVCGICMQDQRFAYAYEILGRH